MAAVSNSLTRSLDILSLLRKEKIHTETNTPREKHLELCQKIDTMRPKLEMVCSLFPFPIATQCLAMTYLKVGPCQELAHRFSFEYFMKFKRIEISLITTIDKMLERGHCFPLIGSVVAKDELRSDEGCKVTDFVPVEKFLADQPPQSVVADPLLDFVSYTSRCSENSRLLQYLHDHQITHVAHVMVFSETILAEQEKIMQNAQAIANEFVKKLPEWTKWSD
jgi:hypothetical protein